MSYKARQRKDVLDMSIGANDKVRIGIIGCGGIGMGKHMPALAVLDNVEMVAFCDIIDV